MIKTTKSIVAEVIAARDKEWVDKLERDEEFAVMLADSRRGIRWWQQFKARMAEMRGEQSG